MSAITFAQLAGGSASTHQEVAGAYLRMFSVLSPSAQALVREALAVKPITAADIQAAAATLRSAWGEDYVAKSDLATDAVLGLLPSAVQDAVLVYRKRGELAAAPAALVKAAAATPAANTTAPAVAAPAAPKQVLVEGSTYTRFPQTKTARQEWLAAMQAAGYTAAVWPNGARTSIAGYTSLNGVAKIVESVRGSDSPVNNAKFAVDSRGEVVYIADSSTVVRFSK